jgi:leader peptidase (prepilin peptidase)/N-methyltransferase
MAGVGVLVWVTVLSVYDVRSRRLPNWLTLPGAVVILAVAALHGRGAAAALGAVTLFAVYAVVHVVAPAAMGAGDVKLAIGIGALTAAFGRDVWLLAALAAPVLTAVLAVVVLLHRAGGSVPHGPSMCVAAVSAAALAVF